MHSPENIIDAEPRTWFFVSKYTIDRCYGGPEEGGWWYDWYDFVGVRDGFRDEQVAREYARKLNDAQKARDAEDGKRDRYSVIGEPDVRYIVETEPMSQQDTERPYYC